MESLQGVNVLFIAGFGPIVREVTASSRLYRDILGIRFQEEAGSYLHTEAVTGAKTFALWPLSGAAQSCFGSRFLSPEGLLVGITLTPSMRNEK